MNTDLEKEVLTLMESIYQCKYTKELKVTKDGNYYVFKLYLHNPITPSIVISKECESDKDFLEYIAKELKDRRLDKSQQYKLIVYGNIESTEGI